MKFPKNRSNLYIVLRFGPEKICSFLGGFASEEEAFDFKDACAQEWEDKVGDKAGVLFDVQLTTFYG